MNADCIFTESIERAEDTPLYSETEDRAEVQSEESSSTPSTSMGSTFRKTYKKRHRKEDPLSIVVKKLDQLEQEDATDAAGKVYAEKLRSLDVKQRIYAEKLISEVFFEAQLGNLSRYTTLTALQDQIAQSQQVEPHFQLSQGTRICKRKHIVQNVVPYENVSDVEYGGPSVTNYLNNFDPSDVNYE